MFNWFWTLTGFKITTELPTKDPLAFTPEDDITIRIQFKLKFIDRIRFLISGKIFIANRVWLDKKINHYDSSLSMTILPPNYEIK